MSAPYIVTRYHANETLREEFSQHWRARLHVIAHLTAGEVTELDAVDRPVSRADDDVRRQWRALMQQYPRLLQHSLRRPLRAQYAMIAYHIAFGTCRKLRGRFSEEGRLWLAVMLLPRVVRTPLQIAILELDD